MRTQLGGRLRCPWVTVGDLYFPPVLARMRHGYGVGRRGEPADLTSGVTVWSSARKVLL